MNGLPSLRPPLAATLSNGCRKSKQPCANPRPLAVVLPASFLPISLISFLHPSNRFFQSPVFLFLIDALNLDELT